MNNEGRYKPMNTDSERKPTVYERAIRDWKENPDLAKKYAGVDLYTDTLIQADQDQRRADFAKALEDKKNEGMTVDMIAIRDWKSNPKIRAKLASELH
jgi:hypothetical protein